MSGISPVVIGETAELRAAVEEIFTAETVAVEDRLHELESRVHALGYVVTFGMEIEFIAVPDPAVTSGSELEIDDSSIYETIIETLTGDKFSNQKAWDKGAVILPEQNSGPVMVQKAEVPACATQPRYNLEQDDIIEIRTAPADAWTAVERYWQTIQAIGQVAQKLGFMGVILSTHVNTAFRKANEDTLLRLWTPDTAKMIAAVQHNLNSLESLQSHAGIVKGLRVNEAYPSKHASTALHDYRAEGRHPAAGVIDPRIDMLCTLSGVERYASESIPVSVLRMLHKCVRYMTIVEKEDIGNGLGFLMSSSTAIWDTADDRFVLPTVMQDAVYTLRDELKVRKLVNLVSGGAENSFIDNNCAALRKFLGQIFVQKYSIKPRPGVELSDDLLTILQQLTPVSDEDVDSRYRFLPFEIYDSPTLRYLRHRHIARSSLARSVLGSTIRYLTEPEKSSEMRDEFTRIYGIESVV